MDVRKCLKDNESRLNALYNGVVPTERYISLSESFRARFGGEPVCFVSAPGRTEVVGNHTDHNKGRVLAASVQLDTIAAIAPTKNNIITLYSAGYDKPFVVDLLDLSIHGEEMESTHALIRGVAARLNELGYKIGGFNACVHSSVFKGSGLSSSAAFEVMLVACMDALYNGWTIDAKLNAKISQYTENVYFGKPSGLLDQSASALGGLVTIDFGPEDPIIESLNYDFDKKGYAVCVVSVGGSHMNLTDEYAAIPTEMKSVAEAMGGTVLAEFTPEQLWNAVPQLKNKVSDRALLRAFHFMDETDRVPAAVSALREDRLEDFLQTVIDSGESSWKLLQNLYVATGDNQEMCLALEMSRRMLSGKGAWRIHGGGFAGTILAFVPKDMLKEYSTTMNAVFGTNATTVLSIRPEGAVCLK